MSAVTILKYLFVYHFVFGQIIINNSVKNYLISCVLQLMGSLVLERRSADILAAVQRRELSIRQNIKVVYHFQAIKHWRASI